MKERKVVIDGETVSAFALAFRIKSPMVDRMGTGDYIDLYWFGQFNCPDTQRWRRASQIVEHSKLPVFRLQAGEHVQGQAGQNM